MTVIISDEAVNIALNTWLGGIPAWRNDATERLRTEMRAALTAALPFLPVQGAVKKLEWRKGRAETPFGPYHVIEETNDDEPFWFVMFNGKAAARCGTHDDEESAIFAAQADYEARILSALEPSAARELALDVEFATIRAMIYCYEGDSAQAFEAQKALAKIEDAIRSLSSPDHADAAPERAWYFKSGDTVPEWLEKIESGYCTLTFGVDVVVTSKDGGYEVRPQGIADNAGPILHVVNKGNVTPEIKGGGNGVAIIGYNRPYDETAGWRIARLKRLLEMARPYVECYDTREHNSEQDAVLTEIDKALSAVVGEPHADAGKVEGDDDTCKCCHGTGWYESMERHCDCEDGLAASSVRTDLGLEAAARFHESEAEHYEAHAGDKDGIPFPIVAGWHRLNAERIRALAPADAGKVEGDGCKRCGGKGEIVVGKGRHGDTIIEDCPSCSTPQDVINLVIAAREACDTWLLPECEFKRLDKALDAFSERVPFENEPDTLPSAPASEGAE